MVNSKKLSLAGLLVAVSVILSGIHIPIGVAKVFPIQHMINIISGILLGPSYAVLMAFTTSVIRVSIGTGSLLAFPGSMFGAFLAGILYKKYKTLSSAFVGEIVGTGLIGALFAYPIAVFLLSKEVAMFTYVIPFFMSSVTGAILGLLGVVSLQKTKIFEINQEKNF